MRFRFAMSLAAVVLALVPLGAGQRPAAPVAPVAPSVLFEGARLIPGNGDPAIEQSAFLVQNGVVTQAGVKGAVAAPRNASRVDLTGKTVMPTLISTHVHPGFQRGTTYAAANFTRDTVVDDLTRALYFGVSVVQSQGIEPGDVLYEIREAQRTGPFGGARLLVAGRGIGAPNAGPGGAVFAGIAYEVTTEVQARQAVAELAAKKADVVKIWVDDRNKRAPRLAPALYRAVIGEARTRGLRVTAHVFYHEDAVDLVNAGIDGFAHLVRDMEMSDALVAEIVKRGVFVQGNLSSPQRATVAGRPAWLAPADPMLALLRDSVPGPVIDRMVGAFATRDRTAAAAAGERYGILERSLAKLNRAGAKIVLGADTGLDDHLFGLAEHLELEAMVRAGLTPMQGIVAATSRGAEYLRLPDAGAMAAGKRADFVVLDANPLTDISNTRRISRLFIGGQELDRAAMRRRLMRGSGTTKAPIRPIE